MSTQSDSGLRERKKQQTRQRIHRVALQLAAEHGLDQVTVDEIAAGAEVSTRTFFNYFPGKDQAVVGVDTEVVQRITEGIAAAPAHLAPLDVLEQVCLDVAVPGSVQTDLKELRMRVIEENPRLLPALFGAGRRMDQAAAQAMADRLQLPADHPYPSLVVSVALAALRSALHLHVLHDSDAPTVVRQAFAMVRAGLPAPTPGA